MIFGAPDRLRASVVLCHVKVGRASASDKGKKIASPLDCLNVYRRLRTAFFLQARNRTLFDGRVSARK
jgi:hypothetical protein